MESHGPRFAIVAWICRKEMGLLIFVSIIAITALGVHFLLNGFILRTPDAMAYACIARNILRGKPGASILTFPELEIPYDWRNRPWPHPGNFRPFHIATVTLSFLLFGISDKSVIYVSILSFLLTVPILFRLAHRIYDERVATVSALFLIFSGPILPFAASGWTESTFMLFTVLCVYLFYERRSYLHALASGFVLGLAYLTRYFALAFLLPFLAYICLSKEGKRWHFFGLFTGSFILTAFGLSKIYQAFVPPVVVPAPLIESGLLGHLFIRPFSPLLEGLTLESLGELVEKVVSNLFNYHYSFLFLARPYLMALYLFSLFLKRERKENRLLNLSVLGAVLIHIGYLSFRSYEPRYLIPLLPLIFIFSSRALISIVSDLSPKVGPLRGLILLASLVFLLLPGYGMELVREYKQPDVMTNIGEIIKSNSDEDEIVLTDVHWAVAWYGDRRAVWIPRSIESFNESDEGYRFIDVVFITQGLLPPTAFWKEWAEEWTSFAEARSPLPGFSFVGEFEVRGYDPMGNFVETKAVLYRRN